MSQTHAQPVSENGAATERKKWKYDKSPARELFFRNGEEPSDPTIKALRKLERFEWKLVWPMLLEYRQQRKDRMGPRGTSSKRDWRPWEVEMTLEELESLFKSSSRSSLCDEEADLEPCSATEALSMDGDTEKYPRMDTESPLQGNSIMVGGRASLENPPATSIRSTTAAASLTSVASISMTALKGQDNDDNGSQLNEGVLSGKECSPQHSTSDRGTKRKGTSSIMSSEQPTAKKQRSLPSGVGNTDQEQSSDDTAAGHRDTSPVIIEDDTSELHSEFCLVQHNADSLVRVEDLEGMLDDDSISNLFRILETAVGKLYLRFIGSMDSNFKRVLGATTAKVLLPTHHKNPLHWTIGVVPASRWPSCVYDSKPSTGCFQETATRSQQVFKYLGFDINLKGDTSYRSSIVQMPLDGHSCGVSVFVIGVYEAVNREVPQGQIDNELWRSTMHTMLVPLSGGEKLLIERLDSQQLAQDEIDSPLDLPLTQIKGCDTSSMPADQALQVLTRTFLESTALVAKSMDGLTKRTSYLAPPIELFEELKGRAIGNLEAQRKDNASQSDLYAVMEAAVRIDRAVKLLKTRSRRVNGAEQLKKKILGLEQMLADFNAS